MHDHDKTFYSYGTGHQECTQHDIRYLTGSVQNEPELTWNRQMLTLFREMLHYRNGLLEGAQADPEAVSGFEAAYDWLLEKAEAEYADEPPDDYYREGYNLFLRLSVVYLLRSQGENVYQKIAEIYRRKRPPMEKAKEEAGIVM